MLNLIRFDSNENALYFTDLLLDLGFQRDGDSVHVDPLVLVSFQTKQIFSVLDFNRYLNPSGYMNIGQKEAYKRYEQIKLKTLIEML